MRGFLFRVTQVQLRVTTLCLQDVRTLAELAWLAEEGRLPFAVTPSVADSCDLDSC
ncbi:MAG: hypothetical protein ACRD26_13625 [Vicinamibacterales bacterium]